MHNNKHEPVSIVAPQRALGHARFELLVPTILRYVDGHCAAVRCSASQERSGPPQHGAGGSAPGAPASPAPGAGRGRQPMAG